jgi:hypothetical protein
LEWIREGNALLSRNAAHAARYMTWTSFNMAATITQGSTSAAIAYGAEHQRYKMCSPDCPTAR